MWATPSTWCIDDPQHKEWRERVAPHFSDPEGWRSHGLGMAQKYLEPGLRLHVWDPSLSDFTEEESTHCHRFAMASHILLGDLQHTEVQIDSPGNWSLASFTTHPDGVEVKVESQVSVTSEYPSVLPEGSIYFFPAQTYHRAATRGLVITLVHLGPKTGPSFALFPPGTIPRHAHGEVPQGALGNVLEAAREATSSWSTP